MDGTRAPELAPFEMTTVATPSIVRFRPAGATRSVARTMTVSVRFSERMDRTSTEKAFRITVAGKRVAGKVTWAEGDSVIVLTPSHPFAYGARVVVTVLATAHSWVGASLPRQRAVSFTIVRKPAPVPVSAPLTLSGRGLATGPLDLGDVGAWRTIWAPWYGPDFYGKRTACGQALTKTIIGYASKTGACGELREFRYTNPDTGKTVSIVAPRIDWGPVTPSLEVDLSAGLTIALGRVTTAGKPFTTWVDVRTVTRAASGDTVAGPAPAANAGAAVGGGSWAAVERYYLKLMNCTRTGGWVTSNGSCSSPGGRNVAPIVYDAGISTKVSRPYARLLAEHGALATILRVVASREAGRGPGPD